MIPTYIGLGSNLQDPLAQLRSAISALETLLHSKLERVSSVYQSAAVGPGPQPDYLNAVAQLQTDLSPLDLLRELQSIENEQGRVREQLWGPRTLDLDVLLYGNQIIDTPDLVVPHPHLHERDFVLYPLREISDTTLVLPRGKDFETLIQVCPENDLIRTEHRIWTASE